eukprot:CAMPEP_0174755190 /NCGR_PEP_ID=MMETSP1094-20130205/106123_1 /TAXON_ID=156173 /ORGANISM="Chrysochromulina brevifilum, Strain UTEX LB 985" /LENGTH=154 /DNA_ID=CAMNT_0015961077 /DNA_START=403 /DNA_END=868 /DNA_ORIENTATION=-
MYNECDADGQLTPSMRLGEIILLHKKKDDDELAELMAKKDDYEDSIAKWLVGEVGNKLGEYAIAHLAPRKSPGPDGVPPEFYRRFATLLAPDLADMYNECDADGQLTPSMRLGEIILLHKKKDDDELAELMAMKDDYEDSIAKWLVGEVGNITW